MPSVLAPAAPALDTARLTLRGHAVADFPECAAMWADPVVTLELTPSNGRGV